MDSQIRPSRSLDNHCNGIGLTTVQQLLGQLVYYTAYFEEKQFKLNFKLNSLDELGMNKCCYFAKEEAAQFDTLGRTLETVKRW